MILAFDVVLVTTLVVLAWQTLAGPNLFRAIGLFTAFGLLMAVAWARLGAPDLALAEAAIGAGVTGGLMQLAYRRLTLIRPSDPVEQRTGRSKLALPVALLAAGLVTLVGLTALSRGGAPLSAGQLAVEASPAAGLANPVTAVLLAFRGLDTLLEVAVLLCALLATGAVARAEGLLAPTTRESDVPLVGALLAAIIPLAILVAAFLLKAGADDPGGAFQAGAVLAGCGVLLVLTGHLLPSTTAGLPTRLTLTLGFCTFAALALAPLSQGRPLLALPGAWSLYAIELAMTFSIGLTLVLLFVGAPGLRRGPRGGA